MQIYLLRHGEAENSAGIADEARRLTAAGRRALRTVLERARTAGAAPSLILASPLARAIETAALAAEVLGGTPETMQSKALLPHADPHEAWEELRLHDTETQVLLAGHEPLFSALTAYLIGAPSAQIEMRKAALARIDLNSFGTEPRGRLCWLLPPDLA